MTLLRKNVLPDPLPPKAGKNCPPHDFAEDPMGGRWCQRQRCYVVIPPQPIVQHLCKHGEVARMCEMCRREKDYYAKKS